MTHRPFVALVSGILLSVAVPAQAQQTGRGFISINGGYQASSTEFDDAFTFTAHQETGTSDVSYPIDPGPMFDAGGGVRLWRGLGAGLALTQFTRDGSVRASSSIPHPFFLGQHRQVEGEAGNIERKETGVHVQAQYSLPLGRRLQITLMGGPSFFHVEQSLVIDVNYTEEYPYDTASFAGVDSAPETGTKTGFNAGADVRWMFTPSVGIGALVRVTRATIELEGVEDRTVSLDAGGTQIGIGIRLAF